MVDNNENNRVGLIARLAPVLGSGLHSVSLDGVVSPPIGVPKEDQEDFDRIRAKIAAALREYRVGLNKICQHHDCRCSRRIGFCGGYLELGVKVKFDYCGHERIYVVEDLAIPKRPVEDPYANAQYDPHRLRELVPKLLRNRLKSA